MPLSVVGFRLWVVGCDLWVVICGLRVVVAQCGLSVPCHESPLLAQSPAHLIAPPQP
jgi:hypothetical protein